MTDLFDARDVPLHEQLSAVERELKMRRRVYPRQVDALRMTQAEADREIRAMAAVADTLRQMIDDGR